MLLLMQERTYALSSRQWSQLGWSSLGHFTRGSPFEFTDAAFSGLLPWGVGFSHSRVAVSLLEFASELPFSLFFGVIDDYGQGHTITLEDKGQGLMCLPYALTRMSTCPPKESGVSLPCHDMDPANILLLNMACKTCLYWSIWSMELREGHLIVLK